jgi:hypothetical protein
MSGVFLGVGKHGGHFQHFLWRIFGFIFRIRLETFRRC